MPGAVLFHLYSVILCCLFPSFLLADELEDLVTDSKILITSYSSQMQMAYETAYNSKNPLAVEEVCKKAATSIARSLAKDGWKIGRTSLDILNQDNAPDHIEKNILDNFNDKQASGTETEKLSWYKFTEVGNHSEFRYIKAFELEQRCMTCHSSQWNKEESLPDLAAWIVKRTETKNYFPDQNQLDHYKPLPVFEE